MLVFLRLFLSIDSPEMKKDTFCLTCEKVLKFGISCTLGQSIESIFFHSGRPVSYIQIRHRIIFLLAER